MSSASMLDPFSTKNVLKIKELKLGVTNSWQGFNLDNRLQSDVLHLAEIQKPQVPSLSTDVFKLQLQDASLENVNPDDVSSSASSLIKKYDIDRCSEFDGFEDIWGAASPSSKSSDKRLLSWDVFQSRNTNIPREIFLSEATRDVHDTLRDHYRQSSQTKQLMFVQETQMYTALANLLLGRSSLLFRWNDSTSRFDRLIDDFSLTGLSSVFTDALCDRCVTFASNFRQLTEFCRLDEASNPTKRALQSAISQVLSAVEQHFLGRQVRIQTVLQLDECMQLYTELILLMKQVMNHATSSQVQAQMVTATLTFIDEVWASSDHLRSFLSYLAAYILGPAIQQTSKYLGLFGDFSDSLVKDEWLLSSLIPEYEAVLIELVGCLSSAREHCSSHIKPVSQCRKPIELVHTWEELTGVEQLADELEQVAMEAVKSMGPIRAQTLSPGSAISAAMPISANAFSLDTFEVSFSLPPLGSNNLSTSTPSQNFLSELVIDILHQSEARHEVDLSPIQALKMSFGPFLRVQHRSSSCTLMKALFLEHDLVSHLKVLHSFQLLGNGNFAARISRSLFDAGQHSAEGRRHTGLTAGLRLENREAWPPASSELRLVLMDLLSGTNMPGISKSAVECVSFAIRDLSDEELEKCRDVNSIHALDFLKLAYSPSNHILDLVISNEALDGYDRVFKFLLVLLRMHALSQSMLVTANDDQSKGPSAKTYHRLCVELHHFTSTLLDFTLNTTIRIPWKEFAKHIDQIHQHLLDEEHERSIELAESISRLRKLHEAMIDEILRGTLLKKQQEHLQGLIGKLLSIILQLSSGPYHRTSDVEMLTRHFRQTLQQFLVGVTEVANLSQDGALRRLEILSLQLNFSNYYGSKE